jgi:hypothetical protein
MAMSRVLSTLAVTALLSTAGCGVRIWEGQPRGKNQAAAPAAAAPGALPRVEPAAPIPPAPKSDAELLVGKWLSSIGGAVEFRADGQAVLLAGAKSRPLRYRLAGRAIEFLGADGRVSRRWNIEKLDADTLVTSGEAGRSSFQRDR